MTRTRRSFITIYQTINEPILRLPREYDDHTTHFRSLVDHLLRQAWERGLLPEMREGELSFIAGLSVLHDIGKALLPPELLHKPGRLSPQEFEQVKTHPLWGEFLVDLMIPQLRGTPAHCYACEICRHHHERWDGGGYPDGLKGNEIPGYVQVIGLADAYDALLAPRSYKPAMTPAGAAELILSGACGAFHPELLTVFTEYTSSIQREVCGETPGPPDL